AVVDDVVVDEYIVNLGQGMAVPDATRDGIDHRIFARALAPHYGSRYSDTDRYVVGTEIGDGLVVGEINIMVLREIGIESDVEQTIRDPFGVHRRHAGDRSGIEHAVANDAQAPGALGDQNRSVGQEGRAPRMDQ